jgi:hypothetical protein
VEWYRMTRLFYAGPPLRVLHEEYAKNGRIDQDAPVTAACEAEIRALGAGEVADRSQDRRRT